MTAKTSGRKIQKKVVPGSLKKEKVLVSACLCGYICRWHGKQSCSAYVRRIEKEGKYNLFPVCPEELGGLPTPRPPVKRRKGRVYETCADRRERKNVTGRDVTSFYVKGAEKALRIARKNKIKKAVLCKWSPTCDRTGILGKMLEAEGVDIINVF